MNHYFKEISDSLSIPLDQFVPPTNSKKKTYFKSISEGYINLIKLSKLFMNDFNKVISE